MQTVVNSTTFQPNDGTFVDFYNQHGWVVIDGVLPPDMVSETTNAWSEMKTEFAIEMGMSLQEYQLEVHNDS